MYPHASSNGRIGIARPSPPKAASVVVGKTQWGRIDMTMSNRRVVELSEGTTSGPALNPNMMPKSTTMSPRLPPKMLLHRLILPPDLASEGKRCG